MSASRRISSAMASRSASRTVMVTIAVPSGISGSGSASIFGDGAAAGCAGALASLAARCCEAGGADAAAFCALAGLPPSLSAEASSPSTRSIAIGVLTGTSLVPAGTRIFTRMPSSTASTSMVALSVSISAITSPDLTASPSFLSHLARLPRSIVGDSAGIKISVGMNGLSHHSNSATCFLFEHDLFPKTGLHFSGSCLRPRCSAVDVGVELGRVGLGVVGGKFRRLVHDRTHLRVDLLERVLARPLLRDQPLAHLLDRVVLAADLVDLFLGAVLGRIRHRMTTVTVGQHLQDDRAVTGAAPVHGLLAHRLHGAHIHAVDLLAGDVVRLPAREQLGGCGSARDRGPHSVLVVLDNV